MSTQTFHPGSLVSLRGRDWIVMPSNDKDLLIVKPLGGTEDETTGIYLPLNNPIDKVETATFALPTAEEIGDYESALLLYNASRLAFRHASGPFRSIGKYAFRPRAYQMVPLIMALKQEDPIRLLIADDVGIGKTVEALMVAREMLDRGEIERFAVVCLPHLCEQWKQEMQDKFGIEAEIIRSSTMSQLERKIPRGESPFRYYPYQVISIDFIKTEGKKPQFLTHAPELVIVDEAHTCARPKNAPRGQQQRHSLLHDLSVKEDQHLVLLTATPHSGKPEEFQSLLGLLKPSFENMDLVSAGESSRKDVARHFVQRRRDDIKRWMKETTPFPDREALEIEYNLGAEYAAVYQKALTFARGLAFEETEKAVQRRLHYWTALGLLRGILSSPRMGIGMLARRARNQMSEEELEAYYPADRNPLIDSNFGSEGDNAPTDVIENADITDSQWRKLREIASELAMLQNIESDMKLAALVRLIKRWLKEGYNPIVYCRYINTAEYVGEKLEEIFGKKKKLGVATVTSAAPDELRQEIVEGMDKYEQRMLVATDCMSEGINLQQLFTAVIHYDLPWNPNRLEQREGRVDRYGQTSDKVMVGLLYGKNNPIDAIVLKVLLRKARSIKESIGISVPFPEDNASIMETVTREILLEDTSNTIQLSLEFATVSDAETAVDEAYKRVEKYVDSTRTIFAQHSIKAQDIEQDLEEVDRMIGDLESVEDFVVRSVKRLSGQISQADEGFVLHKNNLPPLLTDLFEKGSNEMRISFVSPTPQGYRYIGRNHTLVESLCHVILDRAFDETDKTFVSRTSVIKSDQVEERVTVVELRMRNVISRTSGGKQFVSEEMFLWGYYGVPEDERWLSQEDAQKMLGLIPTADVPGILKEQLLEDAIDDIGNGETLMKKLALERAEELAASHERFRKAVGGYKFKPVHPVIPPDVMGVFIILPETP